MYRVTTSDNASAPAETGKPQNLPQLDLAALAPNQIQFVKKANAKQTGSFSKSYRLQDDQLYRQHCKYPYKVIPCVATACDLRSAIEALQSAEARDLHIPS